MGWHFRGALRRKRFYHHSLLCPVHSQHCQMTALMEALVIETRDPMLQRVSRQQADGRGDAHRSVLPVIHQLEDMPSCHSVSISHGEKDSQLLEEGTIRQPATRTDKTWLTRGPFREEWHGLFFWLKITVIVLTNVPQTWSSESPGDCVHVCVFACFKIYLADLRWASGIYMLIIIISPNDSDIIG